MRVILSADTTSVKIERVEQEWSMSFGGVEFESWEIRFLLQHILAGGLVGRNPATGSLYIRSLEAKPDVL